jgi:hypothetical protein
MTEITATLENWKPYYGRMEGTIFGDTKARFRNGDRVMTSSVVKIEGSLCYTRNSVYKLGVSQADKDRDLKENPTQRLTIREFETWMNKTVSTSHLSNNGEKIVAAIVRLAKAGALPQSLEKSINEGRAKDYFRNSSKAKT